MTKDSWNPDQYEKFKVQRSQPFYDLMNLLSPQEGARVVDLGCGTGELTEELHRFVKASETLGIDSSEEMLKKAQNFAGDELSFQKGDIQKFSDTQGFDIIFSNAALQWCSDHPTLFAQLKSSLRPGGQIAIQMPMNHDYATHVIAKQMSLEEPWASLMKEPYSKTQSMLTVEQYASLLFKLGFKEQNVLLKVYGHELESREGVIEWVKGTLLTYFESRLAPADFQAFTAEFRKRLFQELPDDKPFFYPFKRILLWAKI
jgi:trans-aconitate 2-methyltransferase